MHISLAIIVLALSISHIVVDAACWCKPRKFTYEIWEEDDGTRIFHGGFRIPFVEETDDWSVLIQFSSPVRGILVLSDSDSDSGSDILGGHGDDIEPMCDDDVPCRRFIIEAGDSDEDFERGDFLELDFKAYGFKEDRLEFKVTLDDNECDCLIPDGDTGTLSTGVIVGVVFCVVLLFIVIVLLVVCIVLIRRYNRNRNVSPVPKPVAYETDLSSTQTNVPAANHEINEHEGQNDHLEYHEIPDNEYACADEEDTSVIVGTSSKNDSAFLNVTYDKHISETAHNSTKHAEKSTEGWVKNDVYVTSDNDTVEATATEETEGSKRTETIYDNDKHLNGNDQNKIMAGDKTNKAEKENSACKVAETSLVYDSAILNADQPKQNSETTAKAVEQEGWSDNIVYGIGQADDGVNHTSTVNKTKAGVLDTQKVPDEPEYLTFEPNEQEVEGWADNSIYTASDDGR